MDNLPEYRYRGGRAMVLLHEQHMREFLDTWRMAKTLVIELPRTDDPNYASLDTLLAHVIRSGRNYMIWICEMLKLPDPEISASPDADVVDSEAESYLVHLFQKWRKPLVQISEDRFHKPEFTSKWNVDYCIDAMLEHAVMHPMRHSFQLLELVGQK